MIYDTAKDVLVRKRALREIDDGQEILEKVEVKGRKSNSREWKPSNKYRTNYKTSF